MGKCIVKAIMRLLGMLPLKVHYFNAKWIAWLLQHVFRYRRTEVIMNLTKCFPEHNYEVIKYYEKLFYVHLAELIVETIWFGACRNPKRLRDARIMEVVNSEVINHLYEVAPSVVVMLSHNGNWEMIGGINNYYYTDIPSNTREDNVCVVYRKLTSKLWDEIMRDTRIAPLLDKENFPGYIESKIFPRYVYTHKDEKKIYYIITDQRPYFAAPNFIECNFMHQKVRTMSAAASLAAKFGMAVAYLNINRTRQGHYDLEYTAICEDASKMPVEEIMQKYYDLLDKDLHRNPVNYLWTHRRFQI